MVSRDGKMAEALKKLSKLFTKIAAAKSELAKAKEQQINLQKHHNARRVVPLPRVADRPPIPTSPLPMVPMVGTTTQVTVMPTQTVERVMPQQGTHRPPTTRPNYISQDGDNNKLNHRYKTRSQMTSIMQEAILACIKFTKPRFEISAAKLAT
jgi:hypothetical protein